MPKFLVHATQVITQDVVFEVEAPDGEIARASVENDTGATLIDSEDEEYHRNIVTAVVEDVELLTEEQAEAATIDGHKAHLVDNS